MTILFIRPNVGNFWQPLPIVHKTGFVCWLCTGRHIESTWQEFIVYSLYPLSPVLSGQTGAQFAGACFLFKHSTQAIHITECTTKWHSQAPLESGPSGPVQRSICTMSSNGLWCHVISVLHEAGSGFRRGCIAWLRHTSKLGDDDMTGLTGGRVFVVLYTVAGALTVYVRLSWLTVGCRIGW